jgi:hypothetical protein
MRRPLCSLSIDVDAIACYYRIHALGEPPTELRDVVIRRCVPRFAEVFARRGIRATFFIVAQDIDVAAGGKRARAARAIVQQLVAAGHEIGSHSYSHPYDLARLPRARVTEEIERAHELLSELAGEPVRGFRAPGYEISADMLEELMRLGYQYDSSIFPAPGYYAAKAAVMGAMAVAGRQSGAILTSPLALLAPADPYRPSPRAPWRRGQATLVELPIAVTPISRVPVIGTSVLLAPARLRRQLIRAMRRRPHFCFELHGIDLADADEDGIPGDLVARQPELRAPLSRKRAAFEAALDQIGDLFELARVRDVASFVHRELV